MNKDQEVFARSIAEAKRGPRDPRTQAEYDALSENEKRVIHDRLTGDPSPITRGQVIQQLDAIVETLAERFANVDTTIKTLLDRIKELEGRPTVKYIGVYESGRIYAIGNMVSHKGSVWHCNTPTSDPPGSGPEWTLAVKRGQDSR